MSFIWEGVCFPTHSDEVLQSPVFFNNKKTTEFENHRKYRAIPSPHIEPQNLNIKHPPNIGFLDLLEILRKYKANPPP